MRAFLALAAETVLAVEMRLTLVRKLEIYFQSVYCFIISNITFILFSFQTLSVCLNVHSAHLNLHVKTTWLSTKRNKMVYVFHLLYVIKHSTISLIVTEEKKKDLMTLL